MSNCVNCGKKINSFTECVDPYGINFTCKNCSRIFSASVFPSLSHDYDLNAHRAELVAAGVTEDGLSYIDTCISYLKEKEAERTNAEITAALANEEEARRQREEEEKLAAERKARMDAFRCDTPDENGLYYHIEGVRGRVLDVYYDKCVITTNVTLGSIITHNATDGEKTIYYMDCVGVQFKKSAFTIGYLQLETAGGTMNNKNSNFFNENSFTFEDDPYLKENFMNEKMEVVAEFIKKRIDEIKLGKNTQPAIAPATVPATTSTTSLVEDLKALKELVDLGILTQEEFDAKKKQMLGI